MKQIAVYGGRFQLPHSIHIDNMVHAAKAKDHLIIFLGSANQRISTKNPFPWRERAVMLDKALKARGVSNYSFVPVNDHKYSNTQWCNEVYEAVQEAIMKHFKLGGTKQYDMLNPQITLFGFKKDSTSFYLDLFRDWGYQELPTPEDAVLSSTDLRFEWLLNGQGENDFMRVRTDREIISHLLAREYDQDLQSDFDYYMAEGRKFADYPYQETLQFNCADAVIECNGNILLIQRGRAPGRHCWALPGGMKNQNETFFEAAVREAFEETRLHIPEKVLIGSLDKDNPSHLFDDPDRCIGIPRITKAYYFRLKPNPDGSMPRVTASDDAEETDWFSINRIMNDFVMYDDHKDIIQHFTGAVQSPAYLNM